MLAFEHPQHHHHQQHWANSIGSESNFQDQDPNPRIQMDAYSSFGATPNSFQPFSYSMHENPALLVEAPHDTFTNMYHGSSFNGPLKPADQLADLPPSTLSSTSGHSIPSASSSTVGSPYSSHAHMLSHHGSWGSNTGLGLGPTIVNPESYMPGFVGPDLESDLPYQTSDKLSEDFVDPSLIQGPRSSFEHPGTYSEHTMFPTMPAPYPAVSNTGSPAPSIHEQPYQSYTHPHLSPPYSPHAPFNTFPFHQPTPAHSPPAQQSVPFYGDRRSSVSSTPSKHSHDSPMSGSGEGDDEGQQKGRCPNPGCGRVFKDLRAHMLTHQLERPEKCPILNCEYNQKGFARKYDRNRHTLTHYKGTMVCGFCPGSGSAIEKSFNRADVFKRHLTSVHGVEQAPPNSRRKSPSAAATKSLSSYCQDATGKCSTCAAVFSNAQDFYEHLDECVLRVVQQEEPSEAINQQRLAEVASDEDVKETMERHMLTEVDENTLAAVDEVDDDDEDDEDEDEDDMADNGRSGRGVIKAKQAPAGARAVIGSSISKPGRSGRKGFTYSKGGVPLAGKGRKKRKNYPASWSASADKMKMQMKKRVLCVYDGQRRLWKDDLMMHNEFEVRMPLADGNSYVTDLDVETLSRAEAFHNATEEERGPWNPEEGPVIDVDELMA